MLTYVIYELPQSANPILEERCSYSTPMANKDNNLKLNSSGKGNKKVSPRISPMTLGEFQITPKLSQGARKKGRKSDPTSIDGKSTDKENSKKKATFVTVERPNSGASPELTSSSQSKNENLKKKEALTTVAGPNPEVINEKSTDNEKSKKKATFVTVERSNSGASPELTSSSQSKNESPKKKATLITLERTNLDASGRYELTSGSETKSDTKGSLSYCLCFQYFFPNQD